MLQTQTGIIALNVAPRRLWLASFKDSHNFLPKGMSDTVVSVEYDGVPATAGSIRTINFKQEVNGFSYVKEKFDELDEDKFCVKLSLLEGGLSSVYKNLKTTWLVKDGTRPGTSEIISTLQYEDGGEGDQIQYEESMAFLLGYFKPIEEYLLSNNDYASS
eukprot:c24859_g2_i1 orf=145-624(+)